MVAFMAVAAALATSTSYVLQPGLVTVARDLHSTVAEMTAVAGSAIVGYLLGLVVLVPLVDQLRAHLLLAGQLTGLAGGLVVAAVAPNPAVLAVGVLVSGACASTGAEMSTLAGKHAAPARRGRAVGSVTAGISAGILLGRIIGGALADLVGWRGMLSVFAGACLITAAAALAVLPRAAASPVATYRDTLHALPRLIATHRRLRISATSGALWFFAFSLVWVSVSVALASPPLNLSPTDVGLYSLAGLLGILATRTAGALSDRYRAPVVVLSGLAVALACSIAMAFTLTQAPLLLAALALFDAGLFSAQVANQTRVLSLDPKRPAQFNSAYMVVYFVGGSLGTAIGGAITTGWGWPAAAATAASAITLAALVNRTYNSHNA